MLPRHRLFAYNARGEQETQALDMDRNGQIDLAGSDCISRTQRTVLPAHGGVTVVRTTSRVWGADGSDSSVVVAVEDATPGGQRNWRTDANGLLTSRVTVCDGAGLCTTTVTAPDGSRAVSVSQGGRPASERRFDADGLRLAGTDFHYDAHGRLDKQSDARDGDTLITYDGADRLRRVSRAGQTTGYDYDALGRKRVERLPDTARVLSDYWPTGELKSVSGARTYTQSYTYNSQGRLRTLTTAGAAGPATTTWNYDPQSGQLAAKRYADNKGPSYTYTPAGRLLTRVWARGITSTYGRNNAGEVNAITYSDGSTPAAAYNFDRRGRLASAGLAGGDARTFSYLDDGQPGSETITAGPLAGWSLGRTPDALGRRAGLQVAQGGTTRVAQSFGYDGASRLKTAAQGNASATYDYWADSAANLVHTISFARGSTPVMTTTKDYDSLDRLTGITSMVGGTPTAGFGYGYNAAGQREAATLTDGTRWSYGYDGLGQLTQAGRRWASDGSPVAGQQYGYKFDGIGNRTAATLNGRQSAYAPNRLNQYSQRTVPGAVDVMGVADPSATVSVNGQTAQRQQGGYFYKGLAVDNSQAAQEVAVDVVGAKPGAGANGSNALGEEQGSVFLPKTPEAFTYDPDGNTMSDGRWVYTWDAENRLIGLEGRAELTAQAKKRLAFSYDALGRRTTKRVWNWDAGTGSYQPGSATLFLYDGWNIVGEVEGGAGTLLRSYLWGSDLSRALQGAGGVGGLLIVTDLTQQTPEAHFVSCDGNGNVATLVRASDSIVSATYEYGPFGETVRVTGGTIAKVNSIRWSSKYLDGETGLSNFGFRFYNHSAGRWVSRDPINEMGSYNLYYILGNDAINTADYLGLLDYTQLGPYASDYVPAGPESYISADLAKQRQLNDIGRLTGCHHCGATNPGTRGGSFIGDHQDPNGLNEAGKAQRYFPHCQTCSSNQSAQVKWQKYVNTSLKNRIGQVAPCAGVAAALMLANSILETINQAQEIERFNNLFGAAITSCEQQRASAGKGSGCGCCLMTVWWRWSVPGNNTLWQKFGIPGMERFYFKEPLI